MRNRSIISRGILALVAMVTALIGLLTPVVAAQPSSGTGIQIIGGTPATTPWTVSLQDVDPATGLNRHRCGGTLIAAQRVMTAAHCTSVITAGSAKRKAQID